MGSKTKDAILDAAEALFAERGFAATSLRNITAAAGVNIASVNYHFGSKELLIEALFARRLRPMNKERLRRLDKLEREFGDKPVPLDALVAAFVEPALRLSRDTEKGGSRFIKLLGRSYTDPPSTLHERVRDMYTEVIERFKAVFARALPEVPKDELYWRMHFMVGLLAYCMAGNDYMRLIASCRICDPLDSVSLTRRLVVFICAGLREPPPALSESQTVATAARA
jgi:AcrR family transcriptional regulator